MDWVLDCFDVFNVDQLLHAARLASLISPIIFIFDYLNRSLTFRVLILHFEIVRLVSTDHLGYDVVRFLHQFLLRLG